MKGHCSCCTEKLYPNTSRVLIAKHKHVHIYKAIMRWKAPGQIGGQHTFLVFYSLHTLLIRWTKHACLEDHGETKTISRLVLILPNLLPLMSMWTLGSWLIAVTIVSTLWLTSSCDCLKLSRSRFSEISLLCFSITRAACTDACSAFISSFIFSISSLALCSFSCEINSRSFRD